MNDGMKLSYSEGIATITLELRTNHIGKEEMSMIELFAAHANSLWNKPKKVEAACNNKACDETQYIGLLHLPHTCKEQEDWDNDGTEIISNAGEKIGTIPTDPTCRKCGLQKATKGCTDKECQWDGDKV